MGKRTQPLSKYWTRADNPVIYANKVETINAIIAYDAMNESKIKLQHPRGGKIIPHTVTFRRRASRHLMPEEKAVRLFTTMRSLDPEITRFTLDLGAVIVATVNYLGNKQAQIMRCGHVFFLLDIERNNREYPTEYATDGIKNV